ncbi:molybdopterin-dependent oxidoreductase [Halapricum desulfuricans]|uniref:Molybdopterin oxidoreductase n=1 Tax=Halapricum desulfuricans TaxID=2841257 RepID=A0A897NZT4_9EURY|nr:molybdopterin-dependent oxidoreductase [Halapricum desulfuricans]QSG15556.1 Molybdopterin oxidoreductase [Halapricum desulfuricans]
MSTDDHTDDASDTTDDGSVSRREFVAAVGGMGAVSLSTSATMSGLDLSSLWEDDPQHYVGTDYGDYEASDVLHTTCGQCNTFCPIKVRLADDSGNGGYTSLIRKLAGNPYSFLNTQPFSQVPYSSDPEDVATGDLEGTGDVDTDRWSLSGGRMCLKGQAGIQTAFDAYRVRKPMKRVGERGSEEWQTITWEQAIEEIVGGVDGEHVSHDGLEEMYGYAPREEVMDDWEAVRNGEMDEATFDEKYEETLIDTDHPDLGPKANQIVDVGGFRRNFIRTRLWKQGLGSVNSHHHAGTCGFSSVLGNVRSYGAGKKRQYPDIENTEYLIVWGTNPMVANKGPTWLAPKLTNAIQDGMRMDVIDPRMSKTAEKAEQWVPVDPGSDAALALGMARWIIEHNRHDLQYLRNPDSEAASADDEPTWSDATHLVAVDEDTQPKARAGDLGLDGDGYVVVDGETAEVRPASEVERGALDVDIRIDGDRYRSAWSLYRERVFEHTLAEYAEMAGVSEDTIAELADEFTSHGKRAAILSYRGPAKHSNGFQNTRAIATLQHLIGNYDWQGGQITPYAGYDTMGGRYQLGNVPEGKSPWGLPILRAGTNYEDTSLFDRDDGYPAERPWFPVAPPHQVQELYASAAHEYEADGERRKGYPYDIEALFIRPYSENHVMAASGGDKIPEAMTDTDAISLLVAFDTVIGETSKYADYILPEPTYLGRWENFGTYPNKRLADEKLSHPTIDVVPDARPAEDVLIDIWKEMDFPGVGANAIPDADGNTDGETARLDRAEDFYVKLAANLAYASKDHPAADADVEGVSLPGDATLADLGEGPVPDADDDELEVFRAAHEKGLGDRFELEQWQRAVTDEEWRKAVTVLNRGGRFEEPVVNYEAAFAEHGHDYDYVDRYEPSNGYVDGKMRYKLASRVNFYSEVPPKGKDAYSGERFDGLPGVEDVTHFDGSVEVPIVSDGEPDRPLHLINWKPRTQGMHRTTNSPWLRETRPENPLWINPDDADERGIENGDAIEIDAGRRTVEGTAMVTEGIRPGVVGAMWGWGRDANGATETNVDGETREPAGDDGHTPYEFDEPMTDDAGIAGPRDAGFAINHLQPLDNELGDIGMSDPVGGSNAQYDAFVEVSRRD